MGWKEWTAVAVVIGGGILLQIAAPMDALDKGGAHPAAATGPFRTVALDVTGMT